VRVLAGIHAVVWHLRLSLIPVLVVPLLLTGCGSSKPKPDPVREARFVAETNALCVLIGHSGHATSKQQMQEQRRLTTLEKDIHEAAAYLPAGRSFNEAHAKRLALRAKLNRQSHKHKKSGPTIVVIKGAQPFYFIEESYRLQMQAYNAIRALGLTQCAKHPPRAPISG
jgi:hypothetical protein